MGKKLGKKHLTVIIGLILFVCSVVAAFIGRKWLFVSPFQPYALSGVSYASKDAEGSTLVIGNSNLDILKISAEGELLWRACASKKSFVSADRVVADGDGNIYVHDVQIAQGVQVASESIVKLSAEGKRISVIDTIDAQEDCVRQMIVGLVPLEHGAVYMKKEADRIVLYNTERESSVVFPLDNAEATVLCCAYDTEHDTLFYSTYDGKIWQYQNGGQERLLYDSDTVEGSIPQKTISYADGVLYAADIGLRDTIQISCDTGAIGRIAVEEPVGEREIAYSVSAANGLVTATGYSVLLWDEEGYEQIWEVPLSGRLIACIVLEWLALLLLVACAIFLLIQLTGALTKKSSLYTKITLAVIVGVTGLAVLFLGTLFPGFQEQLVDEIYAREKLAAAAVTNRLQTDAFLRLEKPSDFMNEDYMKVRQSVRDVFFSESESAEDLYCVLYRVIDGTVTLVYTLEDICVVYPYDWEYEGTEMQEVMEKGTTMTYATKTSSGSYVFIHNPILDENENIIGIIEVGTDMQSVTEKSGEMLFSLIVNVIAIMVVFFMLAFELIYFMRGRQELEKRKREGSVNRLPVEIFRFIVFLVFFFTNLTCAILPIYAMRIAENMSVQVISPVMLAAIPISAEVVSGAVFSAVGGSVINRLGTRRSILVSSIVFTAGLALRVVPNIWLLAVSSLMLGAGWGVLLLLINIMIVELPDEEKDRGYAYYSVSSLSGANCGVVFGGFLIQWMSYTALFAVTAGLSILLYFVANKYIRQNVSGQTEESAGAGEPHMNLLQFVFRPEIIGFFLLMMVPLLICGYFLNYMFPIIGSEWGLSETYIGYAYILNGIFVLLLGTSLTGFFSNRGLKHLGLSVAAFIYTVAFLEVALMKNIPSLFIALVLIGIADSFGIPLLTSYFTDLKDVERFGYDRGLGVYSLFENGAQSLGSFVFGYVMLLGVSKGLMIVLAVVGILALMFLIETSFVVRRESKGDRKAWKKDEA